MAEAAREYRCSRDAPARPTIYPLKRFCFVVNTAALSLSQRETRWNMGNIELPGAAISTCFPQGTDTRQLSAASAYNPSTSRVRRNVAVHTGSYVYEHSGAMDWCWRSNCERRRVRGPNP